MRNREVKRIIHRIDIKIWMNIIVQLLVAKYVHKNHLGKISMRNIQRRKKVAAHNPAFLRVQLLLLHNLEILFQIIIRKIRV